MIELIIKRIAVTIPTLLALTFILFAMIKAVPGDPAQVILGDRASKESLAQIREDLGLNQPFITQYGIFLKNLVLNGDLGRSIKQMKKLAVS